MTFIIAVLLLSFLGLLALAFLLVLDRRADRAEWNRLAALQPVDPERFAPEMVADLPDPARRYFAFMIQPGTPLLPVVEIDMTGQFSLGTKDNPAYQPMEARQILAATQIAEARGRDDLKACIEQTVPGRQLDAGRSA